MPDQRASRPWPATAAALTAAVIIMIGGAVIFVPYLLTGRRPVTSVPFAQSLRAGIETGFFALKPHQRACLSAITITPKSRIATFRPELVREDPHGGPAIELLITAPRYRSVSQLPPGYDAEEKRSHADSEAVEHPGAEVAEAEGERRTAHREGKEEHEYGRLIPPQQEVAITPPRRTVVGTACFRDIGSAPVFLDGTSERRLTSRSSLTVNSRPVAGVISLAFFAARPESRVRRLGEIFEHASNLTDDLIPVWLIWIIVLAVLLGVPAAVVLAFSRSLREDELPADGRRRSPRPS